MISSQTTTALSLDIDSEGRVFVPEWDDTSKTYVDKEIAKLPAGIGLTGVEHIELELRFKVAGSGASQKYVMATRWCPGPFGRWVPC